MSIAEGSEGAQRAPAYQGVPKALRRIRGRYYGAAGELWRSLEDAMGRKNGNPEFHA